MPKSIEKKLQARGGVVRYRMKKIGGHTFRIAVTRRKGPRGGKTVAWEI